LADPEAYFAADLELGAGWTVHFETLEIDSVHWENGQFFILC
jgi:hypothetical protein